MELSGDQRALLKLIVERGQSYEDIAALLGGDSEQVRGRARRAMAALAGGDLDRSADVTDYLLGQADPIGRADAVRHLSRPGADRDRAEQAVLAILAIAPNAELPDLPDLRAPRKQPATTDRGPQPAPTETATTRIREPLATPQRRLIALIGGVALAVIVAVVAIAGSGDDGADGVAEADPDFVRVELASAAGASGSGVAVIGQTDDDQPFIELDLEGLGELKGASSYVLWLLTDDRRGIPVAPIEVADGQFSDRMPLLSPADLVAAFSRSIVVAVMNQNELRDSLQGLLQDFSEADEEDAQLPITRYRARTILEGQIPTLAELADQAEAEGATDESAAPEVTPEPEPSETTTDAESE